LEPPHLPPLGGQDCNPSLLVTSKWQVVVVAQGVQQVVEAVVRVVI
jgi:hypothetical protein